MNNQNNIKIMIKCGKFNYFKNKNSTAKRDKKLLKKNQDLLLVMFDLKLINNFNNNININNKFSF